MQRRLALWEKIITNIEHDAERIPYGLAGDRQGDVGDDIRKDVWTTHCSAGIVAKITFRTLS